VIQARQEETGMSDVAHKPGRELGDPKELLLGFLDYYRSVVIRKTGGLTDAELRTISLPSGWTTLELLSPIRTAMKTRRGAGTPGQATPPPA